MWQSLTKEEKLKYKDLAKLGKHAHLFIMITQDKEQYLNELKDLTRCNKVVERPKKPLTPYMLFVRAVRTWLLITLDSTQSG